MFGGTCFNCEVGGECGRVDVEVRALLLVADAGGSVCVGAQVLPPQEGKMPMRVARLVLKSASSWGVAYAGGLVGVAVGGCCLEWGSC